MPLDMLVPSRESRTAGLEFSSAWGVSVVALLAYGYSGDESVVAAFTR